MEGITLIGLLGASVVAGAAPGPCILVVAGRAATGGLMRGLGVTLGVMLSSAVLLAAAWAMIIGALSLSDLVINGLRLGGLVVLVALGLAMLCAAPGAGSECSGLPLGDVASGLALGLSNPLQLLFMFALLPQFVDVSGLVRQDVAVASVVVLLGIAVPMVAAAAGADALLKPIRARTRAITRGCGLSLLGFAGLSMVAGS